MNNLDAAFLYPGVELDAMSEARNYCRLILRHFAPYLGRRVAEIGAGAGTFSQLLLDTGRIEVLMCFEPARNLFPALQRRFQDEPRVRLHCAPFSAAALGAALDSVVLVNVLEHIEDDARLLGELRASLRSGGNLLLFVPALEWLYGSLDHSFRHHRRYSKNVLHDRLESAGYRLERLQYVNLPGVAAWFLAGRVLRRRNLKSGEVRFYDRWILPWSSKIDEAWNLPIGQSLVAVALK